MHRGALTLVFSLVVVAGLVWDSMFVCILPNTAVIPSFATTSVSTVDHMLDREVGRRPYCFPLYVDTIWRENKHQALASVNASLLCAEEVELPQLLKIFSGSRESLLMHQ